MPLRRGPTQRHRFVEVSGSPELLTEMAPMASCRAFRTLLAADQATADDRLIRLTKFSNVSDRKRILARYAGAELGPFRRANAGPFHGRFDAFNDFVYWLAVRDRYKNVRISRH